MRTTKILPILTMYVFSIIISIITVPSLGFAQIPDNEKAEQTEEVNEGPEWPDDSLGRRTPHGTVVGFLEAIADEDYTKAAQYFDLSLATQNEPEVDGAKIALALQNLLDQHGRFVPRSLLSKEVQGHVNDDLETNLDLVGSAEVNGQSLSIIVEKTESPEGAPVWLFSSETVSKIPTLAEETNNFSIDRILPAFLLDNKWGGVPVGHWLSMIVLIIPAYLLAWAIIASIIFFTRLLWRKAKEEHTGNIIKAFAFPLRIYLAIWIFVTIFRKIGISIIVRQSFSEIILIFAVVSVLILLWRLVDVFTSFSERRLIRRGQFGSLSAVLFFRRSIKFLLIALGIIIGLDTLGFDVTTGIAALGVGGIALALGAQKTIENFVGSLTLIADQPIRVGDFCKIGDTVGTVEQIGMRSTRVRTLNRTMVAIPNGELSSVSIENYAHRDRFWFHPVLALRYESTPDQIRYLLVELRAILYAHPKVDANPARVRFIGLGDNSLDIEIFAYVHASNYDEFLEVQEDLTLRLMDVVSKSGTSFAFPSQTIYMAKDTGVSEEKTKEAEQKVREWREKGELQIPKFDYERISELKNTIAYPPDGASAHPNSKN